MAMATDCSRGPLNRESPSNSSLRACNNPLKVKREVLQLHLLSNLVLKAAPAASPVTRRQRSGKLLTLPLFQLYHFGIANHLSLEWHL
jgi:hypothetical protein